MREELKDLIDDNPIEESEGEDSDASGASKKRKKSDDEDFDDRLEDEDYDLIEENLGFKVERVSFGKPLFLKNLKLNRYSDMILYFRNVSNASAGFKMRNLKRNRRKRWMMIEMRSRTSFSKAQEM